MPRIAFVSQSAEEESKAWTSQRAVNVYARPAPPGSRVLLALLSVPGLAAFGGGGTGPVWAMENGGNQGFVLSGNSFYSLNLVTGALTLLGNLASDNQSRWASIAVSGTQAVVVAPPRAYVWNGAWTEIPSPFDYGFGSVAYLDGYFVYSGAWDAEVATGRFFVSDLLDAGTINALNFATAESSTDGLVRIIALGGNLWLFGARTIEIWENVGTIGQPFQKLRGGTITKGLAAPGSPAMVDNGICWLGNDLVVYQASGPQLRRVSTHEIEQLISTFDGIVWARGMNLSYDGHDQYVLNFPFAGAGGRTLVWDAATGLWHDRASGTLDARWRGESAMRIQLNGSSRTIVGDATGGTIWQLSKAAATDGEMARPWRAQLPPIWADTKRGFMNRLELEMDTLGGGEPAAVSMSYSDDGGSTWSQPRAGGTKWHRLGSFRQRILRFEGAGGRVVLFAADVDAETGQ